MNTENKSLTFADLSEINMYDRIQSLSDDMCCC